MKTLTHYQRAPNSSWVTIPKIGKKSVALFLMMGTYHQLRYEDSNDKAVSYEVKK